MLEFITQLDSGVLDFIQTHLRTPFWDAPMRVVSFLGDAGLVWVVLALLLLIIPATRKQGKSVAVALSLSLLVCNIILKPWIGRERPFDEGVLLLITMPKDFSFPSGHTQASFAAATALLASPAKGSGIRVSTQRVMGTCALILAAAIGFSRLYLHVHYPTDVLAGLVIGVLLGFLAAWCVRKFDTTKKKSKIRKKTSKPTSKGVDRGG